MRRVMSEGSYSPGERLTFAACTAIKRALAVANSYELTYSSLVDAKKTILAFAMVSQATSFKQLCQCFRGLPLAKTDWMSVICLANKTMTTPALFEFIRQSPEFVPRDVSRYITEIYERNLMRNDHLLVQLREAVEALNNNCIRPVLLKGSALLATMPREQMAKRLISDLDICVSEKKFETSLECLLKIGYRVYYRAPKGAIKCYADLERPNDVGMIDLHRGPPGHDFYYKTIGKTEQYCTLQAFEQGEAFIPSATYHALLLIIHDQFQDSDYWVGDIDMRHLLDLRLLANTPAGIDWHVLGSFARGKLAKNAMETQLISLFSLLDVDVPLAMRKRLIPRMQYWRRVIQIRFPSLRKALLLMALLDYYHYRVEVGQDRRIASGLGSKTWIFPQLANIRWLFDLSQRPRNGKM